MHASNVGWGCVSGFLAAAVWIGCSSSSTPVSATDGGTFGSVGAAGSAGAGGATGGTGGSDGDAGGAGGTGGTTSDAGGAGGTGGTGGSDGDAGGTGGSDGDAGSAEDAGDAGADTTYDGGPAGTTGTILLLSQPDYVAHANFVDYVTPPDCTTSTSGACVETVCDIVQSTFLHDNVGTITLTDVTTNTTTAMPYGSIQFAGPGYPPVGIPAWNPGDTITASAPGVPGSLPGFSESVVVPSAFTLTAPAVNAGSDAFSASHDVAFTWTTNGTIGTMLIVFTGSSATTNVTATCSAPITAGTLSVQGNVFQAFVANDAVGPTTNFTAGPMSSTTFTLDGVPMTYTIRAQYVGTYFTVSD